ncbi:two pore domain potassium channel family protein [Roseomonas nepalensis]|uniref:Two pore domain potassium channel family protein n=1 Tax=Muricoccus nepalensis TaxID=1854500 RepID=A0A502F9Q0_9PROT|nr:potassium channel family protein [Roseomonas nepalensis]TPG46053.1 two pore domain potassium channel family protein [Roseomonas nepalensis]
MTSLISTLAAVLLLCLVLQDAFEVMLLPRRVHRHLRLSRFYFGLSWAAWSAMARRLPAGARRERFLGVFGALSMVVLFAVWGTALIAGFGLLEWALQAGPPPRSALPEQIYMSGVTFFTLGYGDVVPHTAAARIVSVVEAGTGIGFIAVVIGYLPVLYQLFARREAHVIQLDGRAGSPPTACTMLCRHATGGGLEKLDELLREWEVWASELLESHLSYPMLVYYRSQHDNQSWLAATAAVMDTCALILVGVDELKPLQARMTFTMARQVMVEMARSLQVRPSRYDGGDRLPREAYLQLEFRLREAGLKWNARPDAEETLAALRATYEPLLDGLASTLLLTLPGWIATDDAADHWEGGHRGLIASRLIEQLTDRSENDVPASRDGKLAERLRARMRRR